MNKKILTTGGILTAGTLLAAGTAFAALPEDIKASLENDNYTEFVIAAEGTRFERVTEERFENMVDRFEIKQDRRDAVEASDYDAFTATFTGDKEAPSESTFELIIDLHEAREAEDDEAVAQIKEELKETGEWHKKRGHKGGDRSGKGLR